jgi:hypothetical protein
LKVRIFIIHDVEINSFGTIFNIQRNEMEGTKFLNILKQWNKGGKNVGKNNYQHCQSPWSAPIKGGGKKCKTDIIYLQKYYYY